MQTGEYNWVNRELKSLVELKQTERLWHIPLLTSLCVGMPVLLGYFGGDLKHGLGAAFCGFVILYLPSTKITHRMLTLMGVSYGFLVSFTVGIATSFHPVVSAFSLGIYAALVHWVTVKLGVKTPGNFFILLIAVIAGCQPFEMSTIPARIGAMALATMFACLVGFVYSLYITRKYPPVPEPVKTKWRYSNIFESMIWGLFTLLSVLAGHYLTEHNPYWVPVSCLAVMQGVGVQQIWQRSFHRILGTFIGLGLTWVLLSFNMNQLEVIIAIMILQFIIQMLILRNYAMAVTFITPLTIFLADPDLGNMHVDQLVLARMLDITLGSLIGAAGGWMIYHQKLKMKAVRQLRKTSVAMGRKGEK